MKKVLVFGLLCIIVVSGVLMVLPRTPERKTVPSPVSHISSESSAEVKPKSVKSYSIDGSKYVSMTEKPEGKNNLYSFIDSDDNNLYSPTATPSESFALPGNAWDPGGAYFFIQEKEGKNYTDVVLKTSGDTFSDGSKTVDVGDLFRSRHLPYDYGGATGWAAQDLMIVETTNTDGTRGPSYWFEVPSKSFILLAQHQ